MYYKCINEKYFTQNKNIDTKIDNYSIYQNTDLLKIEESANFIFEESKINNIPINLLYIILGLSVGKSYSEGSLGIVINNLLRGKGKTFYKINDLIKSPYGEKISGNKIIKLYESAKNLKSVDVSIFDNGSFLWEWFGEKIRKEKFPLLPSRLDSYFLFKDKKSAEYYINKYRFNEDIKIVMAEPIETIYEKTFDMSIWDEDNVESFYYKCETQMIRYWSSEKVQKIPEILFQGKLRLFE